MSVNGHSNQDSPVGPSLKEWNGFGFKLITESDYPKILRHLQDNWYVDEPMHKILGMTPERSADLDQLITNIMKLNQGSFYAYPLENPDKVAAVLIIWIQEKGIKRIPSFEPRSPLTLVIRSVISQLLRSYDVHEERGVDIYPDIGIASSDRDYRGKGLATEMYRKAIASFKTEGYKLVSSTLTNPFSQKIGERLGFKAVSRMEYSECFHPDGSSVFGEEGKKHFVVETVLDL